MGIVQPGFRIKALFFHELEQLLRSGIPLPKAMEIISHGAGPGRLAAAVNAGLTSNLDVSEAFQRAGLSRGDVAVIEAGAGTGKLDYVFSQLATHYERLSKSRATIITKSLYPVFVLHLAILLLNIPAAMLGQSSGGYLGGVLTSLAIFYGLGMILFGATALLVKLYANQPAFARVLLLVPGLRQWFLTWTGSRFASVFALFVKSGGSLLRGMELAGAASGSVLIAQAARKIVTDVRSGMPLAQAVVGHPGLPSEIQRAIQVGDHSGRLDEECARAAETLEARTILMLDVLSEWLPRLLYVAVSLYIGWRIIGTFMNIGSAYGEVLDME